MRRVELEVRRAEAGELLDLLAEDRRHVPEELLERRVRARRALGVPELREEARARQRDLEHAVGARLRVRELVCGEKPAPLELRADGDRRPFESEVADCVALPLAPEEGVEIPLAEPVHRLDHLALERESPHLTVGDDIHPGFLLAAEHLVDGGVLRGAQLLVADLTA